MTSITQEDRRQTIADATANPGESPERRPIRWRGQEHTWPVVSIPLSHLLLNPNSHRIKTQLRSREDRGASILANPESLDSQDQIAAIIRGTEGYERIKAALARDGQQHPGLVTHLGVLVNANTRAVALRELGVEFIRVQVLPAIARQEEVTDFELRYQMEEDVKQKYTFTNRITFKRDLLDAGWSPEKVGLEMNRDLDPTDPGDCAKARKDVEAEARLYQLIEDLIAIPGSHLKWTDFDDERQNMIDIDAAYQTALSRSDPDAVRIRDAKITAMLAGLDYRKVRKVDQALLDNYLRTAFEEQDAIREVVPLLLSRRTTAAPPIDVRDPTGLDVLDGLTATADPEDDRPTLGPIYDLLITGDPDPDSIVTFSVDRQDQELSPTVQVPRQALVDRVRAALELAVDAKEQDERGVTAKDAPANHIANAARSLDRAKTALNDLSGTSDLDLDKLYQSYERLQRAYDDLIGTLGSLQLLPTGSV